MTYRNTVWVRYTWDLRKIAQLPETPAGYHIRLGRPDDERVIVSVVLEAYASDPAWQPLMKGIEERMTERIHSTLGMPDVDYIVVEHQGKIVAVSGIAKSHWTGQNLLTGICVLSDHQRKGLGKHLLGLSLLRLRDFDLKKAKVYTEAGSLADKKIYPLYGSTKEYDVEYPGLRKQSRSISEGKMNMIARIWHGLTLASKGDEYFEYLKKTGLKDYRSIPGNEGVYVLRRVKDGKAEFLLISFWRSNSAIKKFAGDDYEKARYYLEDKEYLLELEPNVVHYEILEKL
ncbi:MAG: GNAT family N-acetyltransferase [Ignavibacteriae bacterium]|nr:GNAT family N-acetyltransferase [Ignavibacteriota bacterium]